MLTRESQFSLVSPVLLGQPKSPGRSSGMFSSCIAWKTSEVFSGGHHDDTRGISRSTESIARRMRKGRAPRAISAHRGPTIGEGWRPKPS